MSGDAEHKAPQEITEPQTAASAKLARSENVWLVYYKPGVLGNPGPPQLISVGRSEEEVVAIIASIRAHESAEGWDSPEIATAKVPLGMNLVIEGRNGPIALK
jgi:hypothetical protein